MDHPTQQPYPLVPAAAGQSRALTVDKVVQSLIDDFADLPTDDAGVDIATTVVLEPHAISGTWRVRWPDAFSAVIGEVPALTRSEYQPVEQVTESGLTPSVAATISWDSITCRWAVRVHLAPPSLCVPRNNPAGLNLPAIPMLPTGRARMVGVRQGEFTGGDIMALSPGQWIVELTRVGDALVALLDGKALGPLSPSDGADLLYQIDAAGSLAARAFALDGAVMVDALPGEPELVPLLHIPDTTSSSHWEVFEYSDGTVAITVDGDLAIDPEDWLTPKPGGARTVTLGTAAPVTDAPTQYFPAFVDFTPPAREDVTADEAYLTEVEKVRLRRAQRTGSGPRHQLEDDV